MDVSKVKAVYFSPTGTTRKIVTEITGAIGEQLCVGYSCFDFTLPDARKEPLQFSSSDLVVFGTPVYAGRVPNVLLKYLNTIEGNGAASVPIVVYGNRNYDDALIELKDILENRGLRTLAAAAFIGEHAFSRTLAAGRPDGNDLMTARGFALKVAERASLITQYFSKNSVNGIPHPYRGYYQPRDRKGNPVDFRKVKPQTSRDCIACGKCVQLCPMGSVSCENVSEVHGICIKCGACIKECPVHAKYFDDEQYLYHKRDLEKTFAERKEPELFL